jgi:putative DNA primase/helicase
MTWANYDDVHAQLTGYGLLLDDVGLRANTAKPVRCKVADGDREKRGWYWLSEVLFDNSEMHLVGSYGIYRGNDSGKQTVKLGKATRMSDEQKAAIAARVKADQKRMQAMREEEAERAARLAAMAWRKYEPVGASDYLQRKGVQAHGLRFAPSGHNTCAIPMTDATGKVWGLQLIRGKDRGNKLEKQYWPKGLNKQGHYHLIGGTPRDIILIAEGYATGASLREATNMPVAVAFDAGNLQPVAQALSRAYKQARILICADDDYLTPGNPGITAAQAAALAARGAYLAPVFADARPTDKKGATDFNDLHMAEGLPAVRSQVETHLIGLGWLVAAPARVASVTEGGGEKSAMVSRITVDEAALRYWGTYGMGGKVLFDEYERRLVHKDDVMNLLPRHGWENLKDHPDWRVARDNEIGFDPTEQDTQIKCNLFGGWPTVPKQGRCERLLELLEYLCMSEGNAREVYEWILKWLAYPIQHRGAKMHSAVVVHGGQGTGKSRFFEAHAQIYGPYGRVLGQEALEDKFNADWSEKKLFIVADEVLARQDMYHIKNRLKGFITGDTIRVNPKNVAAHNEKNQMNIVFLSNERMPLVLENDDRRHCVIWVPPKLPDHFFGEISEEIENGGIEALHYFLLNLDLGDFKPWTKPPMTTAKQDLIDLGVGSEERFIREWEALELENPTTYETIPFCPCLGSSLYRVYEQWCERAGERKRSQKDLIGTVKKMQGWKAGESTATWLTLNDKTVRNRKIVIPPDAALSQSQKRQADQARFQRDRYQSKAEWVTACFFAFDIAMGSQP